MSNDAEVRVDGTLSHSEQQELITRSIHVFGAPDTPKDAKFLPLTIGIGIALVLVLWVIFQDASVPGAIAVLLVGVVGGYILGLRRVGAVGTHITGWSFRADGARDHYESGGYLFHPWPVLTVAWGDWGLLAAADRKPVVYVPARLLPDRVDVAHIVALAEAGGASVRDGD
jgi:hypothetical protein